MARPSWLAVAAGRTDWSLRPAVWRGFYTLAHRDHCFPLAHDTMIRLMKAWIAGRFDWAHPNTPGDKK